MWRESEGVFQYQKSTKTDPLGEPRPYPEARKQDAFSRLKAPQSRSDAIAIRSAYWPMARDFKVLGMVVENGIYYAGSLYLSKLEFHSHSRCLPCTRPTRTKTALKNLTESG